MTQTVQALVNKCPERSPSATPPSYLVTCWEEKKYLRKIRMENWEIFFLSYVNISFSASKSVKYFPNLINSLWNSYPLMQIQHDQEASKIY